MRGFELLAREEGPERLTVRLRVAPDGPFFAGHFPGHPVLPGVAQLALVEALAGEWTGGAFRCAGVDGLRFRLPLGPGDEVEVELARDADGVRFAWTRGGERVADGRLVDGSLAHDSLSGGGHAP